jgi:hypothetical protein
VACRDQPSPLRRPADPIDLPDVTGCEGLRVVERAHFGASYELLAKVGGRVFAGSQDHLAVLGAPGDPPVERIGLPGRARALLAVGGDLWVASDHAGLVRIEDAADPAARVLHRLAVGGRVRALSLAGDTIWVADDTGRVLALPVDAEPGVVPHQRVVDGWPHSVTAWGRGVLVSTREGGLHEFWLKDTGEVSARRVWPSIGYSGSFLVSGDEVWVHTRADLVHMVGDQELGRVAAPSVGHLLTWGDRVLVAAGSDGVRQWDGRSVESYSWSLDLRASPEQAPVRDLIMEDDDLLVVAAGRGGVAWVRYDDTGWALEHWTPTLGEWEQAVAIDEGIAAAITTQGGQSQVLLLEIAADGVVLERDRVAVPTQVTGLVQVGSELLVATQDLYSIDLERAPGQRVARKLELFNEPVHGLRSLPSGQVAGLIRGRAVVWLERSEGTWAVAAESALGETFLPLALGSHGEQVAVGYYGYGRLRLFERPGEPFWYEHLVSGQLGDSHAGVLKPVTMGSLGERLWLPLPGLGLEAVVPGSTEHRLLRLEHGAWDVQPWRDGLAVALGEAGVGLVDPAQRDEPLQARCGLPGVIRWVIPQGERLVALGGGSAWVLQ